MTVETDWREGALCAQVDPELFYPEPGESTAPAKKVCMACDVRAECLEWALANSESLGCFGVFGGMGPRARGLLLRDRRREIAATARIQASA